ncbi:probable indole-3-pyruvate monooxygenase YUCCA10 [Salvia hispanica]|uniref:probable indole-3-pyruvate monooxygenase YUCCA10 n=1 Tax=Salvia hispanica TaxID=49212 RepID=UPI002009A34A|nr:probable indole-3-pyruvate monooxygenase YUCCA10 [Salvia hispanica]
MKKAAVTIVGGGPSGLATAAYLHSLSIPYILLEREDCFASLWQNHTYDRVHLHLPKQLCNLPLMPMPSHYPTYVPRRLFVDYLNDYVTRFHIRPVYRRSVEAATYEHGEWKIEAKNLDSGKLEEYRSRFLVVATGESCDPSMPEIKGLGTFTGEVLHSTAYKNGGRFAGKKVLVVGSGNSGMEIAVDLSDHGARTSIVIRSPIHILSRRIAYMTLVLIKYLPRKWADSFAIMMSKFEYGDLTKYGIQRPKMGPFALKDDYGKYPVIDAGTVVKIKSGEIKVLPEISSIKGNCVTFENGTEEYSYDVLIFATGFKRSTKQWLKEDDNLLNEDGIPKVDYPNHWKSVNGLYCVGFARKGLYGAAMDAQNIAHHIKSQITH